MQEFRALTGYEGISKMPVCKMIPIFLVVSKTREARAKVFEDSNEVTAGNLQTLLQMCERFAKS